MSRSRRSQPAATDRPKFAENFEVGRSVCDCFLKSVKIKEEGDRTTLLLSFLKESSWITKFITLKSKKYFDTTKQYNSHRLEVKACLENLLACYVSGGYMKHIDREYMGAGFVNYLVAIEAALTESRFWEIPVCLKTVPMEDGSVRIGRYAPFMNRSKNTSWVLSYSGWEIEKYKSWYKINSLNNINQK